MVLNRYYYLISLLPAQIFNVDSSDMNSLDGLWSNLLGYNFIWVVVNLSYHDTEGMLLLSHVLEEGHLTSELCCMIAREVVVNQFEHKRIYLFI